MPLYGLLTKIDLVLIFYFSNPEEDDELNEPFDPKDLKPSVLFHYKEGLVRLCLFLLVLVVLRSNPMRHFQFDFEVQSDMIQFSYVFASEEYPEYAPPNSSAYSDVFAFYISGPGITGEENIALVPLSTDPVTINNINAITNNQYYIDNTGGTSVQFDAFFLKPITRGTANKSLEFFLKYSRVVFSDAR